MVKKFTIFLIIFLCQNSYSQNSNPLEIDAFYARQRKEKNEFTIGANREIELCKTKFSRWFKTNDPDVKEFYNCKKTIEQKIQLYNQMQALEACTTFKLRCH